MKFSEIEYGKQKQCWVFLQVKMGGSQATPFTKGRVKTFLRRGCFKTNGQNPPIGSALHHLAESAASNASNPLAPPGTSAVERGHETAVVNLKPVKLTQRNLESIHLATPAPVGIAEKSSINGPGLKQARVSGSWLTNLSLSLLCATAPHVALSEPRRSRKPPATVAACLVANRE